MPISREEYSLLRVGEDSDNSSSTTSHQKTELFYITLRSWTAYTIIATGIFSLISLLLSTHLVGLPFKSFSNPIQPTRWSSQYMNLNKSYHESAQATTIFSYAQIVLQLDPSDPKRRLHEDSSRENRTPVGTVYPDDRHFIVSTNISTVIQLRSRDFGFEHCVVAAVLPNLTKTLDPAVTIHPNSILDIWELDTHEEISPYIMDSWKLGARRRRSLGQFLFLDNATWTSEEFYCPSGSFFTFEVGCSRSVPLAGCYVDFWQNRESPNGLYMRQFR